MQRYSIRITGKVQGVAFRVSAQHMALRLGVAGFVRNEPDGSVLVEAEGDETTLKKFLIWCHSGPAHATVTSVSVSRHAPAGYRGFEAY